MRCWPPPGRSASSAHMSFFANVKPSTLSFIIIHLWFDRKFPYLQGDGQPRLRPARAHATPHRRRLGRLRHSTHESASGPHHPQGQRPISAARRSNLITQRATAHPPIRWRPTFGSTRWVRLGSRRRRSGGFIWPVNISLSFIWLTPAWATPTDRLPCLARAGSSGGVVCLGHFPSHAQQLGS